MGNRRRARHGDLGDPNTTCAGRSPKGWGWLPTMGGDVVWIRETRIFGPLKDNGDLVTGGVAGKDTSARGGAGGPFLTTGTQIAAPELCRDKRSQNK